jgi:hypothetical protein
MENSNDRISFTWKIYLNHRNRPKVVQEVIELNQNNANKDAWHFGELLCELCFADAMVQHKSINIQTNELRQFIGDKPHLFEHPEYVFFEALQVFASNVYRLALNSDTESKEAIRIYIGDSIDDNENLLQQYVNKSFGKINNLVNRIIKSPSIDITIYDELIQCIKEHSKVSKLLPQYYGSGKRCVAVFKFLHPKYKHGVVSFSGYQDCDDTSLYAKLSLQSNSLKFQKKIHEIAACMNLYLAKTHKFVKKYKRNKISKRIEIENRLYLDPTPGDNYSCCERKIFAHCMYRRFRHGTLYVRFIPCPKCEDGIEYERIIKGAKIITVIP